MQTIYGFSKTNTWIIRSFYAVLTRQTSEKVAFKSGFDNILEYFLLVLLPESSAKISVTGGGGTAASLAPPGSYAYDNNLYLPIQHLGVKKLSVFMFTFSRLIEEFSKAN